jgi:hypothetical protein
MPCRRRAWIDDHRLRLRFKQGIAVTSDFAVRRPNVRYRARTDDPVIAGRNVFRAISHSLIVALIRAGTTGTSTRPALQAGRNSACCAFRSG